VKRLGGEFCNLQTNASTNKYVTPDEGMARLYIGNLSFDTTVDTLKSLLSQHGDVVDLFINEDQSTGISKGFAFAQMNPADAENAIAALDDMEVDGRQIRVSKAEKKSAKKKIYIGNLSFDTEKSTVQNMLEEFGTVYEIYMPRTPEGSYRGFAIVTLDPDIADTALVELDGVEVDGRYISIKEADPKGSTPKAPRAATTKLYIGNLSFYTPLETVRAAFSEFGEVVDCFLPTDPESGGSRGFGFVTMKSEDAAIAVTEMDGVELDGRFVQVNEAQPKGQQQVRSYDEE
jgi:RNA recognition motif-containing protein